MTMKQLAVEYRMTYDYGLRDALRVMTECIFEQIPLSQMEFTAERPTEEAAREFIHEWVQNDGVW